LEGGVSARVTALEIRHRSGATQKLVVRQHGDADRRRNPNVAADEFRLLQILQAEGLPAPIPVRLEYAGEIFDEACIVVEYIEGESASANPTAVTELAHILSSIHGLAETQADLSFLPRQAERHARLLDARPDALDDSMAEGRIRKTLEALWPPLEHNTSVLLHGDFWPGNTLWKDGNVVGVLDWEDAALGDPLSDLANARLEISWWAGSDAMEDFTNRYREKNAIDYTQLPCWDLCAALRPLSKISSWSVEPTRERRMREQHRVFVARALEALS
jgi:aminoglycoside phosphotransferase (APT) family kinase protein